MLGASGPLGIAHATDLLASGDGDAVLALSVAFGGQNGATLVGAP